MTKINKAILLLILLPLMVARSTSVNASAVKDDYTRWQSGLEESNRIQTDVNLSPLEKVEALTRLLDKQITRIIWWTSATDRPNSGYEYVRLIMYIAEESDQKKRPAKIDAINSTLQKLDTMPSIANKQQVHSYLNLALAYAGGNASEVELVSLLNNPEVKHTFDVPSMIPPETSDHMVNFVLDTMLQSKVPIRALPRLLSLSAHPLQFTKSREGETERQGTPTPYIVRTFPIREKAFDALQHLGVQCEKLEIQDPEIWPRRPNKLSTTIVQVNYQSVADNLRKWLLSNDPAIWQIAAEITPAIKEAKVQSMLTALLKENQLSDDKKTFVRKITG